MRFSLVLLTALLPSQGEDGFWRSTIKFPNRFPNPETSGTSAILEKP
jgi:rhamnogalacturonyl hydrolase YesR